MLLLNKDELVKMLTMEEVIKEVENVYVLKAQQETVVWPLVDYIFEDGKSRMDIRSGYVKQSRIHGMKMLNNFPNNLQQGLPAFNGVLMVFSSDTGILMGIMDASYITGMRTGAAGAIGAKYLAREDSKTLFVLGAGKQAIFQITATLQLLPQIETVYVADPLSYENANAFVDRLPQVLKDEFFVKNVDNISFIAVTDMQDSLSNSDVVITITPSLEPIIKKEWLKAGTHLSCIGADMPGKQEIESSIMSNALVFTDDLAQCLKVGEIEKPVKEGYLKEESISGEIGNLINGNLNGRKNNNQITIFDATGLALLDLVVAKMAIHRAEEENVGIKVEI